MPVAIAVILLLYYLGCAVLFCACFLKPLPSPEKISIYTGVVESVGTVSRRFGAELQQIRFSDGVRINMDVSFRDGWKIQTGDKLSVGCEETLAGNLRGYTIEREGVMLHDFDQSKKRMDRERRLQRVLTIALALTPPVIAACGFAWERRILGKEKRV